MVLENGLDFHVMQNLLENMIKVYTPILKNLKNDKRNPPNITEYISRVYNGKHIFYYDVSDIEYIGLYGTIQQYYSAEIIHAYILMCNVKNPKYIDYSQGFGFNTHNVQYTVIDKFVLMDKKFDYQRILTKYLFGQKSEKFMMTDIKKMDWADLYHQINLKLLEVM